MLFHCAHFEFQLVSGSHNHCEFLKPNDMKNAKTLSALLLCMSLFTACSVEDVNADESTNQIEDVVATDGEIVPPVDDKGGS